MKRICLFGLVTVVICFCACSGKPTTYEEMEKMEQQQKGGQGDKNQEQENPLDELEMSTEHIDMQIGKSLKINAKVTPIEVYQDGLECYSYKNKLLQDGDMKKLVNVINEYYGKDVISVEFIEKDYQKDVTSGKYSMDPDGEHFVFSLNGSSTEDMEAAGQTVVGMLSKLAKSSGEDISKITETMPKVYQSFGYLVNYDFGSDYDVISFNQKLYENEKLLYGEKAENEVLLDANLSENEKEFYYVTGKQMIADKIPLNTQNMLSFSAESEKEVKGLELTYHEEEKRAYIGLGDGMTAVFDSDGVLQRISVDGTVEVTESLETIQIKNLKVILEQLVKELGTYGMKETEVYSVELVYDAYLSPEKDAEGVRKLYLAPYWKVQYHREGNTYCCTNLYLASTGEKIYGTES